MNIRYANENRIEFGKISIGGVLKYRDDKFYMKIKRINIPDDDNIELRYNVVCLNDGHMSFIDDIEPVIQIDCELIIH